MTNDAARSETKRGVREKEIWKTRDPKQQNIVNHPFSFVRTVAQPKNPYPLKKELFTKDNFAFHLFSCQLVDKDFKVTENRPETNLINAFNKEGV